MATSPTMEPSVAAAITPPLEAGRKHRSRLITRRRQSPSRSVCAWCVHVQVITSRLMEQLSVPAVLLARQMYFPVMPLVRLLSLRVPCLSSARYRHMLALTASIEKEAYMAQIYHTRGGGAFTVRLSNRSMLAGLAATGVTLETEQDKYDSACFCVCCCLI